MTEGNVARWTVAALTAPNKRRPAADWRSLDGLDSPGLYAWFVDPSGANALSKALAETVEPGLIYGGQAGAGSSLATLRTRIGGESPGLLTIDNARSLGPTLLVRGTDRRAF